MGEHLLAVWSESVGDYRVSLLGWYSRDGYAWTDGNGNPLRADRVAIRFVDGPRDGEWNQE